MKIIQVWNERKIQISKKNKNNKNKEEEEEEKSSFWKMESNLVSQAIRIRLD